MGKHVIEYDEKCKACKGTGLYVGMCENDGAAVVCHNCDGTGCHHVKQEYEDFEMKVRRDDVERVYETSCGMGIGKSGAAGITFRLEDFGGMPYHDWMVGLPFPPKSEMRKFTCPAWWYQSVDYKKKPNWEDCGWGAFSACQCFGHKEKCWARFDKEQEEQR